jgi:hypothetical protein
MYVVEDESLVVFIQVFGVYVVHCHDDNLKVQVWDGLWWHGLFGTYVTNAYIIVINDDFTTNVNYNLPYALDEVQFRWWWLV